MLCFSENLFSTSPGGTSPLLTIDTPQPNSEEQGKVLSGWSSVWEKNCVPSVMVEPDQGSSSAYLCSSTSVYSCLSSGGFPSGSAVKNRECSRSHRFDPWVGKIPRRRKWQPTPVFLPGKSHGQRSMGAYSSGSVQSWSQKSQK